MKSVSFGNSRGYMNTTLKNGECPVFQNFLPEELFNINIMIQKIRIMKDSWLST